MSEETSDYLKYRGKCKQYVDAMIKENSELIAVRGYYICPFWGKQQHWWCKDKDNNIIDPTVRQFPTAGIGAEYEEFNGFFECEQCGNEIHESDIVTHGHHVFCSSECLCRCVIG